MKDHVIVFLPALEGREERLYWSPSAWSEAPCTYTAAEAAAHMNKYSWLKDPIYATATMTLEQAQLIQTLGRL